MIDAVLGCSRACSSCDGAPDCKCKCHARNRTRMRKERPTMRIELHADSKRVLDSANFAVYLDPTTPEALELWKSQTVPTAKGTRAINPSMPPMPPIRCTMPVPCGVCWYCRQREARK